MKKYIIGGIAGIAALVGIAGFVYANPFYFPKPANTSNSNATNASSTPTYITPGTATNTSAVYDSYKIDQTDVTEFSKSTAPSKLFAFLQVTATTGVPTINVACESSRDGIDYYPRDCYANGTTSRITNLETAFNSYTWAFSSSTCAIGGQAPSAAQSNCRRSFEVVPFSRFTRLVISAASTTNVSTRNDDGAVYAELDPIKEESR